MRIVGRDELQTHHSCLASEDLVLSVMLSSPRGDVKWYKDGEKLRDTDHVHLEQDGAQHSLVILGAECCDTGEYLCDSGDDSLIFYVTVKGKICPSWERGRKASHEQFPINNKSQFHLNKIAVHNMETALCSS